MPIWVTLYLALMVASLPMGVLMLRRMERDWLHPVGGLLSSVLSIIFVLSYWLPNALPMTSNSTVLLFLFVLFWDAYTFKRLKNKLPDYFGIGENEQPPPGPAVWLLGALLMLPAYFFGAMVCLRVIE